MRYALFFGKSQTLRSTLVIVSVRPLLRCPVAVGTSTFVIVQAARKRITISAPLVVQFIPVSSSLSLMRFRQAPRGRGFPEKMWPPLRVFRHAEPACASHADRLDPASSLKGDALQPHINPDSDKNFGNWYKQLPARPGGNSTGFAITYFEAALPRQKTVDFLTWSFHLTMMIYTRRIL